eukprot:3672032-Prymnesium_polylepis.2
MRSGIQPLMMLARDAARWRTDRKKRTSGHTKGELLEVAGLSVGCWLEFDSSARAHTGQLAYACENLTPSRASRSMCGVRMRMLGRAMCAWASTRQRDEKKVLFTLRKTAHGRRIRVNG